VTTPPSVRRTGLLLATVLLGSSIGDTAPPARAEDGDPKKPVAIDADLDSERTIVREARSDPRNLKPDAFPVVRKPVYAGALEARNMDGEEWVIGVVVGKTALSYPVLILNHHEIVVDAAEGIPFLVCW